MLFLIIQTDQTIDTTVFTVDNIFKLIDIILKIILGIIVVVYINNRNNKTKKKEILFNLYLSLTNHAYNDRDCVLNEMKYKILKEIQLKYYAKDEYSFVYEYFKSLSEETQKIIKIQKIERTKFINTSDTIKLILGKITPNKKDDEIMKNCKKDFFGLNNNYDEEIRLENAIIHKVNILSDDLKNKKKSQIKFEMEIDKLFRDLKLTDIIYKMENKKDYFMDFLTITKKLIEKM